MLTDEAMRDDVTIAREALQAALTWMEQAEVLIEDALGICRTLDEIEADGDLSPEIIAVRKALASRLGEAGEGE